MISLQSPPLTKHRMTLGKPTDDSLEALLDRYRRSDPKAFAEFFARTSKLVFNYLFLKLGSRVEAEDVMQETYFRVHRYILSYDPSRKAFPWLIFVAKNAMLDHIKARKVFSSALPLDDNKKISPMLGPDTLAELRQLTAEACKDLTAEEVDLLFERVINDSRYEEIADAKGISVESARQRVSRLLKKLKSRMSTP